MAPVTERGITGEALGSLGAKAGELAKSLIRGIKLPTGRGFLVKTEELARVIALGQGQDQGPQTVDKIPESFPRKGAGKPCDTRQGEP